MIICPSKPSQWFIDQCKDKENTVTNGVYTAFEYMKYSSLTSRRDHTV